MSPFLSSGPVPFKPLLASNFQQRLGSHGQVPIVDRSPSLSEAEAVDKMSNQYSLIVLSDPVRLHLVAGTKVRGKPAVPSTSKRSVVGQIRFAGLVIRGNKSYKHHVLSA
ncbi:hypothetical protein RRG08_054394 [Elysia crispata]|uniref:Uncharacterized protein n=1 Tax=Elysia crispata TaxID=231223 RepID=A0AAE1B421_9GAST|nr:hypothetical protein RRG08_054394 [Elysia crispata]